MCVLQYNRAGAGGLPRDHGYTLTNGSVLFPTCVLFPPSIVLMYTGALVYDISRSSGDARTKAGACKLTDYITIKSSLHANSPGVFSISVFPRLS